MRSTPATKKSLQAAVVFGDDEVWVSPEVPFPCPSVSLPKPKLRFWADDGDHDSPGYSPPCRQCIIGFRNLGELRQLHHLTHFEHIDAENFVCP